jgi:hypothetical protein
VPDYTHRDRRAHRDVSRALWTVLGVSVGLIGLAMAVPISLVGLLAVLALAVVGAGYVGWSDRMLGDYSSDLRHAREGSDAHGFARVEASSMVGLDRDHTTPPSPSPHVRRRPRAGRAEEPDPPLPGESDPNQP